MGITNDRQTLEQEILASCGLKGQDYENLKASLAKMSDEELKQKQASLSKGLNGSMNDGQVTDAFVATAVKNAHKDEDEDANTTTHTEPNGDEVTETKENGQVIKKVIKSKDNNNNEIVTAIEYKDGKPSKKTVKKNGNTIETATYEYTEENGAEQVKITSTGADKTKTVTTGSEVDEVGNIPDGKYISQTKTNMAGVTTTATVENGHLSASDGNFKITVGDKVIIFKKGRIASTVEYNNAKGLIVTENYDYSDNGITYTQRQEGSAEDRYDTRILANSLKDDNPISPEDGFVVDEAHGLSGIQERITLHPDGSATILKYDNSNPAQIIKVTGMDEDFNYNPANAAAPVAVKDNTVVTNSTTNESNDKSLSGFVNIINYTNGVGKLNYDRNSFQKLFASLGGGNSDYHAVSGSNGLYKNGLTNIRINPKHMDSQYGVVYSSNNATEKEYLVSFDNIDNKTLVFNENGEYVSTMIRDKSGTYKEYYFNADGTIETREYAGTGKNVTNKSVFNSKGQLEQSIQYNWGTNNTLESYVTTFTDKFANPSLKNKQIITSVTGDRVTYDIDPNLGPILSSKTVGTSVPIRDKNNKIVGYRKISDITFDAAGHVMKGANRPHTYSVSETGLKNQGDHYDYSQIDTDLQSIAVDQLEAAYAEAISELRHDKTQDHLSQKGYQKLLGLFGLGTDATIENLEGKQASIKQLRQNIGKPEFSNLYRQITMQDWGGNARQNFINFDTDRKEIYYDLMSIYNHRDKLSEADKKLFDSYANNVNIPGMDNDKLLQNFLGSAKRHGQINPFNTIVGNTAYQNLINGKYKDILGFAIFDINQAMNNDTLERDLGHITTLPFIAFDLAEELGSGIYHSIMNYFDSDTAENNQKRESITVNLHEIANQNPLGLTFGQNNTNDPTTVRKYAAQNIATAYDNAINILRQYDDGLGYLDYGFIREKLGQALDKINPTEVATCIDRLIQQLESEKQEAMSALNAAQNETEFARRFKDFTGKDYNESTMRDFINTARNKGEDSTVLAKKYNKAFGTRVLDRAIQKVTFTSGLDGAGDIALMLLGTDALGKGLASAESRLGKLALKLGKKSPTIIKGLRALKTFSQTTTGKIASAMGHQGIIFSAWDSSKYIATSTRHRINGTEDPQSQNIGFWNGLSNTFFESLKFGAFAGFFGTTVTSKVTQKVMKAAEHPEKKGLQAATKMLKGLGKDESASAKNFMVTYATNMTPGVMAQTASAIAEISGFTLYETANEIIEEAINNGGLPQEATEDGIFNYLWNHFKGQVQNIGSIKAVSRLIFMHKGAADIRQKTIEDQYSKSENLNQTTIKPVKINGEDMYEMTLPNGNKVLRASVDDVLKTCAFINQLDFAKNLKEYEKYINDRYETDKKGNIVRKKGTEVMDEPGKSNTPAGMFASDTAFLNKAKRENPANVAEGRVRNEWQQNGLLSTGDNTGRVDLFHLDPKADLHRAADIVNDEVTTLVFSNKLNDRLTQHYSELETQFKQIAENRSAEIDKLCKECGDDMEKFANGLVKILAKDFGMEGLEPPIKFENDGSNADGYADWPNGRIIINSGSANMNNARGITNVLCHEFTHMLQYRDILVQFGEAGVRDIVMNDQSIPAEKKEKEISIILNNPYNQKLLTAYNTGKAKEGTIEHYIREVLKDDFTNAETDTESQKYYDQLSEREAYNLGSNNLGDNVRFKTGNDALKEKLAAMRKNTLKNKKTTTKESPETQENTQGQNSNFTIDEYGVVHRNVPAGKYTAPNGNGSAEEFANITRTKSNGEVEKFTPEDIKILQDHNVNISELNDLLQEKYTTKEGDEKPRFSFEEILELTEAGVDLFFVKELKDIKLNDNKLSTYNIMKLNECTENNTTANIVDMCKIQEQIFGKERNPSIYEIKMFLDKGYDARTIQRLYDIKGSDNDSLLEYEDIFKLLDNDINIDTIERLYKIRPTDYGYETHFNSDQIIDLAKRANIDDIERLASHKFKDGNTELSLSIDQIIELSKYDTKTAIRTYQDVINNQTKFDGADLFNLTVQALQSEQKQGIAGIAKHYTELYHYYSELTDKNGNKIFDGSDGRMDKKEVLSYMASLPEVSKEATAVRQLLSLVQDCQVGAHTLKYLPKEGHINPLIAQDVRLFYEAYLNHVPLNDVLVPTHKSLDEAKDMATGDVFEVQGEKNIYIKNEDGTTTQLQMDKATYCKLFPPIERYATTQNDIGNCWQITGFNGIMRDPAERHSVLETIRQDGDDIVVRFQNGKLGDIRFKNGELPEGADPKYYSEGALGINMLEYAQGCEMQKAKIDEQFGDLNAKLKQATTEDERINIENQIKELEEKYSKTEKYTAYGPETDYRNDENHGGFDFASTSFREGGHTNWTWDLLGYKNAKYIDFSEQKETSEKLISSSEAFKTHLVGYASKGTGENEIADAKGLVSGHAYWLRANLDEAGKIKDYDVLNPWGITETTLSKDEVMNYGKGIYIADKKNSHSEIGTNMPSSVTSKNNATYNLTASGGADHPQSVDWKYYTPKEQQELTELWKRYPKEVDKLLSEHHPDFEDESRFEPREVIQLAPKLKDKPEIMKSLLDMEIQDKRSSGLRKLDYSEIIDYSDLVKDNADTTVLNEILNEGGYKSDFEHYNKLDKAIKEKIRNEIKDTDSLLQGGLRDLFANMEDHPVDENFFERLDMFKTALQDKENVQLQKINKRTFVNAAGTMTKDEIQNGISYLKKCKDLPWFERYEAACILSFDSDYALHLNKSFDDYFNNGYLKAFCYLKMVNKTLDLDEFIVSTDATSSKANLKENVYYILSEQRKGKKFSMEEIADIINYDVNCAARQKELIGLKLDDTTRSILTKVRDLNSNNLPQLQKLINTITANTKSVSAKDVAQYLNGTNVDIADFSNYVSNLNFDEIRKIAPEFKNFDSKNFLQFMDYHYRAGDTKFTQDNLALTGDFTTFLAQNYVDADNLSHIMSVFPNTNRNIGTLPKGWTDNVADKANIQKEINRIIDGFVATGETGGDRDVDLLQSELSGLLNKNVTVEDLGQGAFGTGYKVSVDGSIDVVLKIFHKTPTFESSVHGQHIETQTGAFLNKNSDQFVKFYFGRVAPEYDNDGYLVTQYMADDVTPSSTAKENPKYNIHSEDAFGDHNIINGKIIDYGAVVVASSDGKRMPNTFETAVTSMTSKRNERPSVKPTAEGKKPSVADSPLMQRIKSANSKSDFAAVFGEIAGVRGVNQVPLMAEYNKRYNAWVEASHKAPSIDYTARLNNSNVQNIFAKYGIKDSETNAFIKDVEQRAKLNIEDIFESVYQLEISIRSIEKHYDDKNFDTLLKTNRDDIIGDFAQIAKTKQDGSADLIKNHTLTHKDGRQYNLFDGFNLSDYDILTLITAVKNYEPDDAAWVLINNNGGRYEAINARDYFESEDFRNDITQLGDMLKSKKGTIPKPKKTPKFDIGIINGQETMLDCTDKNLAARIAKGAPVSGKNSMINVYTPEVLLKSNLITKEAVDVLIKTGIDFSKATKGSTFTLTPENISIDYSIKEIVDNLQTYGMQALTPKDVHALTDYLQDLYNKDSFFRTSLNHACQTDGNIQQVRGKLAAVRKELNPKLSGSSLVADDHFIARMVDRNYLNLLTLPQNKIREEFINVIEANGKKLNKGSQMDVPISIEGQPSIRVKIQKTESGKIQLVTII